MNDNERTIERDKLRHRYLSNTIKIEKSDYDFLFIFNTLSYGGFLINKTQFDREKVFEALDV